MNSCKSCKHWATSSNERSWDQPTNFNKCHRIIARWKIPIPDPKDFDGGPYESEEYENAVKESIVKASAYVEDGSDYTARLKTREDFGCTLWEGKGT